MCGRAYHTYTEEELFFRYWSKKPKKIPSLAPNFNMSPSQTAPIIRGNGDDRTLDLFRWGLVPSWAQDLKVGYKMINARADTIAEKPSFRNAFKSRRCIIPLSGFIEWKRDGETKRPFKIFLKNEPIMSLAGIWETWKPDQGEEIQSFSIITTEANSFMEKIHDRMPVILDRTSEEVWLGQGGQEILKPCPPEWLEAREISIMINSPKNNRKEVLEGV